jgi:trans-aconitate methyltransferase
MNPLEVANSYDRIASYWDGPQFNRDNGVAPHERAIRFASQPGFALDAGCGSSGRIIDLLLARKFEVEGLDISAEMLKLARRRHPDLTFHHADICEWTPSRQYSFISAWDSIWHVPLSRQLDVIAKLCSALTANGVLIFTTGGVESPEERHNPCLDQPMYHAAPGIPAVTKTLASANCACRHLEYDQYPGPHVFIIAQRERNHVE